METLIEGAVLAVIVVLVFLRDWRATLIAAVALPLAVIPTFWAMDLMGFSLNLVSLLGDHAGRPASSSTTPSSRSRTSCATCGWANRPIAPRWRRPTRSASPSSRSRSTIVAVFAPVSFMGGIAGQYFRQFGLTVAVAVLISLLVARLITPMMAAYFLRAMAMPSRRRAASCAAILAAR